MITNKDLSVIDLSPTKKDFYQIWNELLDTAKKLSDRWDPTSTNESDPGIVLLKVLAAIADKLNYNIDKNILEVFMPSAAQEESMRKLTEMLGYNMKYYQSAITDVTIVYTGADDIETNLEIPYFTNITNTDKDINYIVIPNKEGNPQLSKDCREITLTCIEGQLVQCESDNDNIISINQLDDRNRYYLPESQIAENGIFVYNLSDTTVSDFWDKVDNLNTQKIGVKVYKFGYDSKEGRPYLQFPDDISQLIDDGLVIYYVRTSGINGNIAARTLSAIELPDSIDQERYPVENFVVTNKNAAKNGRNIETINDAYNNYKKTIGTFDTLVSCRDYMNKIYQLVDDKNISLVSNVIVSDIRDDINHATTICSFNEYGICYKNIATDISAESTFNHFDLMLYPFKTVTGLNNYNEYTNSFKLDKTVSNDIVTAIEDIKTISHNFKLPAASDIVCIKNYLCLNAIITTTAKINTAEEAIILGNIKEAIYTAFNMRQLDFGEEIPFDSILEVVKNADARIKNVALQTPILLTKFMTGDNEELDFASTSTDGTTYIGRDLYNKLVVRNILAGRVELFNYNTSFKAELDEEQYPDKDLIYPTNDNVIEKLTSSCEISTTTLPTILSKNEVIKLRKPNFKATVTYPAYVNYYLYLGAAHVGQSNGNEAHFISLLQMLNNNSYAGWVALINYINAQNSSAISMFNASSISDPSARQSKYDELTAKYGCIFKQSTNTYAYLTRANAGTTGSGQIDSWYYLSLDTPSVLGLTTNSLTDVAGGNIPYANDKYNGLYRIVDINLSYIPGYLIDGDHAKYQLVAQRKGVEQLVNYYVQDLSGGTANNYGLGIPPTYESIPAGQEYKLTGDDWLAINYTPASTSNTDNTNTTNKPISIVYKASDGDVIIKATGLDLYDSLNWHQQGHSYTKTVGLEDFARWEKKVPGMFAFGPNEQVEILEPVSVKLDKEGTYLYWILNNKDGLDCKDLPESKYMLEDGEYLFYTNSAKLSLAYYGAGTELVLNNVKLEKPTNTLQNEVSAEDILENGIDAIPWVRYDFNEGTKNITVNEYTYITLTEKDELKSITLQNDTEGTLPADLICNTWRKVALSTSSADSKIEYRFADDAADTYTTIVNSNDNASSWEVRSYLAFNTGPQTTQTLYNARDKIYIWYEDDSSVTITPSDDPIKPISIKTNYTCQMVTDTYNTIFKYIDAETKQEKLLKDFKVKVFEEKEITNKSNNLVTFDNFNDIWTKIDEASLPAAGLTLYTAIPSNNYGLLLIYVETVNANETNGDRLPYITVTSASSKKPKIYNNYTGSLASITDFNREKMSWWTYPEYKGDYIYAKGDLITRAIGDVTNNYKCKNNFTVAKNTFDAADWDVIDGKYYLNSGMNVLLIENGITDITIHANDTESTAIFLISNLDLVTADPTYDGLNIGILDYQQTAVTPAPGSTITNLLLKDLYTKTNELKYQFYYNCPMDSSSRININPRALTTDLSSKTEKLSSARIWYDYNNINNKFVISEIDADYLDKGIQIDWSSKR